MLPGSLDIEKRSSSWLILAMLLAVFIWLALVILRITPDPSAPAQHEWWRRLGLFTFVTGTGLLTLWLGVRSRLTELTEEGLVVPGWSGPRQVLWSEIARVRGRNLTLVLYDRTGGVYTLPWTVYRNPVDVKDFVRSHLPPSARWDLDDRPR
jgi:hypothetical protein